MLGRELQHSAGVGGVLLSFVAHPHPAATQLLDDAVVRDGLPDKWVGISHSAHMLGRGQRQVNELNSGGYLGSGPSSCVVLITDDDSGILDPGPRVQAKPTTPNLPPVQLQRLSGVEMQSS